MRWCLSHSKSGSPRSVLLLLLVLGDCADAAVARIQDTWQISTIHISLHRLAETRLVAASRVPAASVSPGCMRETRDELLPFDSISTKL